MRQIYSSASIILFWLGKATEQQNIPRAFELLALAVIASRKDDPDDLMDLSNRPKITWSAQRNAEDGFPPAG